MAPNLLIGDIQQAFLQVGLTLKENTYVDNLMKTGDSVEELKEFKHEATTIMEEGRSPVHKWESNLVPRTFPFLSLGRREKALAPGGHMTFNTQI